MKNAVVTGATKGIGSEFGEMLRGYKHYGQCHSTRICRDRMAKGKASTNQTKYL